MLSSIQTNPQISSLTGAGIAGAEAGSETGQFDFMNYLLGLESPALELILPDASANQLLIGSSLENGEAKEDPLMDVFGKQGNPLWNPIFPNGMVQTNVITSDDAVLSNQKTNVELNKELQQTKGLGESVVAPKVEKREESTQAFLQTHEDLSKVPVEAKPSQAQAIQKYVPAKEAEGNTQEQAPIKMEHVAREVSDKPEVEASSLSQGSPLHAQIKAEIPEEKRKVDEDKNRDIAGLEFRQPVTNSGDLSKVEMKEAQPHSIPEVFQKVESMVHHGGGKMTVSLNPEDLGKVEIEVTARGKNVEIRVQSENDVAKSAIEGKLADLKHSLQTQDLNLSKLEVHVGTKAEMDTGSMAGFSTNPQNQQSYAQSQERFQQSEGNLRNNAKSYRSEGIASAPMVSAMRSRAIAPGRVDIRI